MATSPEASARVRVATAFSLALASFGCAGTPHADTPANPTPVTPHRTVGPSLDDMRVSALALHDHSLRVAELLHGRAPAELSQPELELLTVYLNTSRTLLNNITTGLATIQTRVPAAPTSVASDRNSR